MSDSAEPTEATFEATATDDELKAILRHNTSVVPALGKALRLAGRTAATGLPLAALYAIGSGLGVYYLAGLPEKVTALDPATRDLISQIGVGLSAFLLIYTAVQFSKRDTATRASWVPSLFAAPAALFTGGMMLSTSEQAAQLAPVLKTLFFIPWTLVWASIAGAAVAVGWVRAGHGALVDRPVAPGAVLDEVRRRTLEVSGPHGGRVHAVTIGMQVLVPGIFYALQLAFTDMVAVLDPDRPALGRSGLLTYGMRGRLFRLFVVWIVVSVVVASGLAIAMSGGDTAPLFGSMVDPQALPLPSFLVMDGVWALTTWVLELALVVLYVEREGQVRAKRELRRRKGREPKETAWAPPEA